MAQALSQLEKVKRAPDLVVRMRYGKPDAHGRRRPAYRDYSSKSLGIEASEKIGSSETKKERTPKVAKEEGQ
ncbi:MAG TPA: hypothetical protein VN445_09045 [Rectinemataceae bacterium]|nr:hypothetical protein [Rectinemataceae bacterium]